MRLRNLVIAVLLGLLATPVWADSDGYYCLGRDYIAYQFGIAAPPVAPHRLYIIRLGDTVGIAEPVVFELPQFQVQGMLCAERTVQLAAVDAIYTVQLDPLSRPVAYGRELWSDYGHTPPQFVGHDQNLGAWSHPVKTRDVERVPVSRDTAGREFVLEITPKFSPTENCVVEITTRILETSAGQTVAERLVFHGNGYRECGVQDLLAAREALRGLLVCRRLDVAPPVGPL